MKNFKIIFLAVSFFTAGIVFSACGGGNTAHDHNGHSHDATHEEAQHGEGKAYTSAYVCPMHCDGSGSEEAGNCPVCGMEYVKIEDHKANGHTH